MTGPSGPLFPNSLSRKKPRRTPAAVRRFPHGRLLGATVIAVILLLAGGFAWTDPHRNRPLSDGAGSIRWATTVTDSAIQPPAAAGWRLALRWILPPDQPLTPPGAAFAADGNRHTAAWYVVRSSRPSTELWHVEKETVEIRDSAGNRLPWAGGSGALLIDTERRLQYVYLEVDGNRAGTGSKLSFRLSRPGDGSSEALGLPY